MAPIIRIRFDKFLSHRSDQPSAVRAKRFDATAGGLAGGHPLYSRGWTAELSATYEWAVTGGSVLALAGGVSSRDKQYYTGFDDEVTERDGFPLYDA